MLVNILSNIIWMFDLFWEGIIYRRGPGRKMDVGLPCEVVVVSHRSNIVILRMRASCLFTCQILALQIGKQMSQPAFGAQQYFIVLQTLEKIFSIIIDGKWCEAVVHCGGEVMIGGRQVSIKVKKMKGRQAGTGGM